MQAFFAFVIITAFSTASFSSRAVRRAAAGDMLLLLGLAFMFALPALTARFRRMGRAPAWCRVVPDPLDSDLKPVQQAIAAVLAEARITRKRIKVDLSPLYGSDGVCRPYEVCLARKSLSHGKNAYPLSRPQVQIFLPDDVTFHPTARCSVDSPGGVRLIVEPLNGGDRLIVRHDAWDLRPGLRFICHPVWAALSAGALFWNLGRHGSYAPLNPALPLWMLAAATLSALHQVTRPSNTLRT